MTLNSSPVMVLTFYSQPIMEIWDAMDLGGGLGLVELPKCEWTGRLGANRRSIKGRVGTSRRELPVCERQGSGFPFSHDMASESPWI